MNKIELPQKKILVTGASQGIGEAISKKLASCGADIMLNYYENKDKGNAQSVAKYIKETYKVQSNIFEADVSNSKQVEQMFEKMDSTLGEIDILVNNAGFETLSKAENLEESEWDAVINTCLKGPFLCAKQAIARMKKKKKGVIVNISSIHDVVPRRGLVHYCSAKAGLRMLSKCLSLELTQYNIRVVTISPGAIRTEMNREEIAELGEETMTGWIPQGRIGTVSDIANSVAFMVSDLADYINGADLYVDGSYMNSTIQYDPTNIKS